MQRLLVTLALVALLVGFSVPTLATVEAQTPFISANPSSGAPNNTTVTVTGQGFPTDDPVSITFNNSNVGTASVSSGTFSFSFTVPPAPGGARSIVAGGATTSFNVTSTSSLSTTSGAAGDRVSVTGQGFAASQSIDIRFGSNTVNTVSASANGSLSASFTVPSVSAGSYPVNVGGSSTTFSVSSSFTVSPSSGPPGTSVQITGSGYQSGANVDLTLNGTALQSLQADSSGNLFGSVEIPGVSGGSKTIRASSNSGTSQTSFEVTPLLVIDQPTAAPGSTVNITGTAFKPNETGISIKFDGNSVSSGITADSQGYWSSSFQVPASTAGEHNVTASGPSSISNPPTARLTIGAGINLDRSSGPPGTSLKINGSGARSNERVTLNVGNGLARSEVSANGSGIWSTNIVVPPAPRGPLNIVATGTNNQSTTVSFDVTSTMTLSAPTGAPGGTITITGKGFGANESGINITFAGSIITSVSADSQGSWSSDLMIPPSPKGTYQIEASGSSGTIKSPFSVAAGLSVNKPQITPGETVTVSGSGFAPNETGIRLNLGDTTISSGIAANGSGSWSTSFTVPPMPANSYDLVASGAATSAGSVQKQTLTLLTLVTLSQASGYPGSTLVLAGKGFGASEQNISVTFDGTVVLSGIKSDSQGAFTTSLQVPSSTAGRHSIVVSGASGVGPGSDLGFQVVPGLILEETSGASGRTMQVTGTGFAPGEQNIEIKFGETSVASGMTADLNGEFEESFRIPPAVAGRHTLTASGSGGTLSGQAQQTYTVEPNISLSETSGSVGMNVSVSGTGFSPDASITLSYDEKTEGRIVADDSGSFNLELTVPASIKGAHSVIALDDSGNRVQEIFEIESIPPTAPVLRSPGNGDRGGLLGSYRPTIKWAPVEDDSGVTYNLQVASDPDFLDILVDRKGLPSPSYRLAEDESLERGTYYWRVQAVDLASNVSPYSTSFEMKSGIVPVWLLSAMVVLGIIASGGGAYAFYTRVYLPRRVAQEAPAYPDFVRISRPEIAAPSQGSASTAAASTPALTAPRRALPSPFRRTSGSGRSNVSPQQQAHMQMVTDFVRSIPLLEVSPDLAWMEELVESLGGAPETIFQQVLRGDMEPIYQPPWMQHPTYQEMQNEPAAGAFLEGLETYIEAVNDCAADTLVILRRIYNHLDAAGPLDALDKHQWRYVMTITQSTVAWFRGTYLGQPSTREYIIESGTDPDQPSLASLSGVESSPFKGVLVDGLSQEDLVFYRDLHIQLRNTYRVDDEARALAAKMTSTSALKEQLSNNIAQMGQ